MNIKNLTYKGVTLFLVELRKHLATSTAGNFWKETSGKTAWPIKYTWKGVEHNTLQDLVNWFIANHNDVSDAEFNVLLNELPSIHWILQRKGFFMLETFTEPQVKQETEAEVVAEESHVEDKPEVQAEVTPKRGRAKAK